MRTCTLFAHRMTHTINTSTYPVGMAATITVGTLELRLDEDVDMVVVVD